MHSPAKRGIVGATIIVAMATLGACSSGADPTPDLQAWVSAQPLTSSKGVHLATACIAYPSVGRRQREATAAEIARMARSDGVDVSTQEVLTYLRHCHK